VHLLNGAGRLTSRGAFPCTLEQTGWRCRSPGVVTARGPFVITHTVCYQTQLITAGLPCLPVSCCPHWSEGGDGALNDRALSKIGGGLAIEVSCSHQQSMI
jgi:hypothetical protein